MKIIITQAGWTGYTGPLGQVEFVNGISVDDLGKGDIQQIAACIVVEEYKDGAATGLNPSVAQIMVDTNYRPAEVVAATTLAAPAPAAAAVIYTTAELHKIADTDGIKGIRAIADPLGLKGTSMAELVGKILAKQAEDQAKAKAAVEAVEAEASAEAVAAAPAVSTPE